MELSGSEVAVNFQVRAQNQVAVEFKWQWNVEQARCCSALRLWMRANVCECASAAVETEHRSRTMVLRSAVAALCSAKIVLMSAVAALCSAKIVLRSAVAAPGAAIIELWSAKIVLRSSLAALRSTVAARRSAMIVLRSVVAAL